MTNNPSQREPDRLADLLADEASAAITPEERRELEQLARSMPPAERESFLKAASLVQVHCLRHDQREPERLPAHLRARLADQGQGVLNRQRSSPVADIGAAREKRRGPAPAAAPATITARPAQRAVAAGGWAVAACLAVALAGVLAAGNGGTADRQASRSDLLARTDSLKASFTGSDARYGGVTGDVVWNDREQVGYLRLVGLPANDPAKAQYQLWIIDPDRDRHPVDGGVFDVRGGEAIIPIQAKLAVDEPSTFAITLEQPGGVVVSAGPLLVVATTT